jgi:GNAT superfamily N-acetyltransferase
MIRPARQSDLNFIKSSFFESSTDSAIAHSVAPELYRRRWTALIDRLVGTYPVLVFADDEAPDVILGWVLHDGAHVVFYLFVREEFRRQGIARALLQRLPSPKVYSFRTTIWQRVSRALAPHLIYDPTTAWSHFGAIT